VDGSVVAAHRGHHVITIVGIPWARAAFNIALYTLLPFGQTAVNRADYTG
jgi:uncharacterized membrane protein YccF (DUF307 family)